MLRPPDPPTPLAAHLAELVARLPGPWREQLAQGPLPEPEDLDDGPACRVCDVLLGPATDWLAGRVGHTTRAHAAGHAALALHDWHQALLGDSRAHLPTVTEGPVAYARCCAIYRAAGWQP